jgi:hypothetical protein
VVLLHEGREAFQGSAQEAVGRYFALVGRSLTPFASRQAVRSDVRGDEHVPERASAVRQHNILSDASAHRHGSRGLEILAARVSDKNDRDATSVEMLEPLAFDVLIRANQNTACPNVGVNLFDRFGTLVFAAGALQLGHTLPDLRAGDELLVRFEISMDVAPGAYTFSLAAGHAADSPNPNLGTIQDRLDRLGPIMVRFDSNKLFPFYGVARLPTAVVAQLVPTRSSGGAESGGREVAS